MKECTGGPFITEPVTASTMYNQSKSLPLAGKERMINRVREQGGDHHQLLPGLCRFAA